MSTSKNQFFIQIDVFCILVTDALSTSQHGISGRQRLECEAKRQWLKWRNCHRISLWVVDKITKASVSVVDVLCKIRKGLHTVEALPPEPRYLGEGIMQQVL